MHTNKCKSCRWHLAGDCLHPIPDSFKVFIMNAGFTNDDPCYGCDGEIIKATMDPEHTGCPCWEDNNVIH